MELELGPDDYLHTPTGTRQRELIVTQVYDRAYLEKRYAAIDANVRALSAKRLRVLEAFVPREARTLLDYGCGTGRFVEAAWSRGWQAHGCDVVPGLGVHAPEAVRRVPWEVVTFFDSLEHLAEPAEVVRELAPAWVMVSVPECHFPTDWAWFGPWRHRRPGEHLFHWNRETLDAFFALLGYRPVMHSSFEDRYRVNAEQKEPNILSAIYERVPACAPPASAPLPAAVRG